MKAPKSINIAQGINPKKLINLLKNNKILLLKGKEKTFKIRKDYIQVFQNQILTIEQVPTQINNLELSDLQKIQLIHDGVTNTPTFKITLDKDRFLLNIQKNIRQNEPVRVNRSRTGRHRIR